MITKDEVLHIANLAKIKLKPEETERFAGELSNILDFFSDLKEVDTDTVEETSQVTGLENATRVDEIIICKNPGDLLACSPHPKENHSVRIPKIM